MVNGDECYIFCMAYLKISNSGSSRHGGMAAVSSKNYHGMMRFNISITCTPDVDNFAEAFVEIPQTIQIIYDWLCYDSCWFPYGLLFYVLLPEIVNNKLLVATIVNLLKYSQHILALWFQWHLLRCSSVITCTKLCILFQSHGL